MIKEKEIKQITENTKKTLEEKPLYSVTSEEVSKFKDNKSKLQMMIFNKKIENDKKYSLGSTLGYEKLEELCQISVTSLKKTIRGTDRITRTFLYKFCVGLQMSIEEANEYFKLLDGPLNETYNLADAICHHALRDKDSIYDFCDEYEKHVGKKLSR